MQLSPLQTVGWGPIVHHLPLYEEFGHFMAFRMQVGKSTVRLRGSISCSALRREPMQGLKIGWGGRFFVMAAPVDGTGNQKDGKKRRKEERRIMVESFVKKFRSANGGEFPRLGFTHKQVGGGFYIIREIMQEIIHEYKVSENVDKVKFSDKQTIVHDLKPISVSAEMSVPTSKATAEDLEQNNILALEVENNQEVLQHRGYQNDHATDVRLMSDSNGQTVIMQENLLAEESIGTFTESNSVESVQTKPEEVLHEKEHDNNVVGEQQLPSTGVDKQQGLMEFEIQTPDFSQNVTIESQSESSKKFTPSVGTEDSNGKTHATSFSVPERSQSERPGYKRESTGHDYNPVKLEGDTDETRRASKNLEGLESSQQLQEKTVWGNIKAFTKEVFSFWKKI